MALDWFWFISALALLVRSFALALWVYALDSFCWCDYKFAAALPLRSLITGVNASSCAASRSDYCYHLITATPFWIRIATVNALVAPGC